MAHIPRIHVPGAAEGTEVTLEAALAHHLGRVLRLGDGDPVQAFDGAGREFDARLVADGRSLRARIGPVSGQQPKPPLRIHLLLAISRHTRMEWTLEKAVELGAGVIHPLFTERSRVKLDERRAGRKLDHWGSVVQAAAAQSGRAWMPELALPRPLEDIWDDPPCAYRLILSPEAGAALDTLEVPSGELALLVGPESGFSKAETRRAREAGWRAVRLGPRILRAETAAPAALAAIQVLWGDWRGSER